ncbi:hypothetical protein M9Y10_007913 [Tritrichomonas musculus]|uniref:PPM-type phosphatase domain-containing protein n=1 Tax=Tritrichomonas musculus TaxID=1915356 RepID=A0ABR2J308_9EUKA
MLNQSSFTFDAETENVSVIDMNLSKFPISPPLENKVKYFYLRGNRFISLPENMKEIIFVDLSNNGMGPLLPDDIAKALSSYPKLKTLCFTDNKLENLQDFFKNDNIDSFNLAQNHFHELPEHFFENFPKLETLTFDCNFLINFPQQKSDSVITLSMPLNRIESISSSDIYFSHLTTLDLSKNRIKTLPNNFSKSFPKLSYLNLSDNLISQISEDDTDDSVFPQTLRILDLSNNFIEKFSNSITSISNLLILNIINNRITCIPQLQGKIKKIRASRNLISKIENQELNLIKHFTLAHNGLTEFPSEIKMKVLETFKISYNLITEIPKVNYLPKTITRFDISFNQIKEVPKEIFQNLPNLEIFSVQFNKIESIPAEIESCRRLRQLNVSYNPIKKLPQLPKSIETISASNCQLDTLDNVFQFPEKTAENDSQAIQFKLHLSHADFSGNSLQSFPDIESIQILNLSQNRLKKLPCLTGKIEILDVSMNELDSIPEAISSPRLIDLNLSHNRLTQFPKFGEVGKLRYLELSSNPIEGIFGLTDLPSLERIDVSDTKITIGESHERLLELITYKSDSKISTFSKKPPQINSPLLQRPIYVNQTKNKSGYSEFLGLRNEMEDSIILRDDLNLYGVFDGHSGPDTAKFASIQLCDLFEKGDKCKPFDYLVVSQFILSCFDQTEEALENLELPDGSTLCLAFICDDDDRRVIVTAHLGDTRALVVCSDGKARELTKDHRPTERSEYERIRDDFGNLSKDNRIDGVLAVSRSIGDLRINGVGREPELNMFEVDVRKDRFLVIACDGVFDVLSNECVAAIASAASSPKEAAFSIRNAAFASASTDNISVIVVDLTV